MAETVGTAKVRVEGDASDFGADLSRQIDKALSGISKQAEAAFSKIESGGSRMGDALGKAGASGADRLSSSLSKVDTRGLSDVGRASQAVTASLSDTARSTGNLSSSFRMIDATRLSGITTVAQGAASSLDRAANSGRGLGSSFQYIDATRLSGVSVSADRAAQSLGKVGTSARSGMDGATNAAQGLIGKLGGIAVAAGAVMGPLSMIKGGFDRLMNIQRAEIGFKNIGLTAEQTEAQMAKLTEQVTGTSVSLSDAAKYSAMFAQSGVEMGAPMDDSIKAFTSLAAAAQGTGTDVGVVMQQISAAGRLMGGDAMQLQGAGINIYKYVADYMGKSIDEVKKLGEEGKITFEDVVGSINAGMGDYAKEMGETLPAKIANLKTSVSSLGAFLIEPFIGPMTAAVEFGTALFKNVKAPLSAMAAWFAEGSVAADVLKVAIAAIGTGMAVGAIVGLVGKVGLLTKAITFAKNAWAILNLAFLGSGIGLVVVAIAGLVAGFVVLWNKSEAFRDFWIGMWDGVVDKVMGVVNLVKAAWDELTAAFSGGDMGYGALESLIGTEAAQWAVNAMANVKDAWTELTTAFSGGDWGSGALSQIVGEGAAETIVNAVASIGDALRTAWDVAKEFGSSLLDSLAPLLPVVLDLVQTLGGSLWTVLKTVVGAVMDVAQSVWGLVQALAPVLLPILKVVGAIIGATLFVAIKALTVQFQLIAQVVKVAATVFSWLVSNILTPLVSFLVDVVAGAFTMLIDVVTAVANGIGAGFSAAWEFLQAAWDAVGRPVLDFIVGAFQFWWDSVTLIFRLVGAAFEVLWTGMQIAWDTFGRPIVDFIVAAFNMWWDGMQIIFGWVKSGWDLLWAGVRAVYDTVIAPVVGWVVDRFNDLRTGVGIAIGVVRDVLQGLADRISAFYGTYVQPMVDRFLRGFERIRETVVGWKDTVVNALAGAGQWLWDAGKNVVQGFINGIKSLAGTIGDAFLNMIPGWIKDPFKKALGIASPSKLFATYGQNIGEGLINGLQSMTGRVETAAGGLASNAAAGASVALDVAPSAAPVVSNVEAAGSEIAAAASGGDNGYAGLATMMGEDAAKSAVDMSAIVGGAFTATGEAMNATKTALIDPALTGMQNQMAQYGLSAQTALNGVVVPAMNAAGAGLATTKASLFDPVHAGLQASVVNTGVTTQNAMLGTVLPSVQQAGAGIMSVQTGTVDPALASMRGAVANTQASFASGAAGISAEFAKVRPGTADPARFAINTVFNDGIVGMWNGVSDMIGTKKIAPHPIGFATGTSNLSVLPGYTPGSDPYTFVEPRTGMSIGLSGGESIMRPEVTRALGTHRVDSLNAAARLGGVSAVRRTLGQFSNGGVVGNFAGGGVVESIVGLVNKYFPGMSITSTYRNSNDHHGSGLAVDFSNGTDTTPQMQAAARFFHQNYAAGLLELIHWPLNGWQNIKNGAPLDYGPTTNAQHRNHVHVAAARPLPAPGGLVMPVPSGGGVAIDWTAMVGSMLEPQADEIRGKIGGSSFPGVVGELPGKVFESMYKPMKDTITEKMKEMGGSWGGGGGAEQWRGLAMQALARHGYNPADHIAAMLQQIDIESGGNPTAVNNWDINAINGVPSGGLLQVIEPTYRRVRNAYPDAFQGLPDDRFNPLTNLTAGVGAVRMDWGGPQGRWPTRGGYDQGGVALGAGLMQKHIVEPERVLNPRQTKAFEAWMAAGQNFDAINSLVDSVKSMNLDHPDVMAADLAKRVADWIGDEPAEGSLQALAQVMQSGIEWERVTQGMQRSAEAWANGDWVQVAADKRLATPEEMATQVREDFLSELADEFGGLIGVKGLYKGRDIVGESGLMDLKLPDEMKVPAAGAVPDLDTVAPQLSTDPAALSDTLKDTEIGTAAPTATATTTNAEGKVVTMNMTINVNGAQDPMAVKDLIVREMQHGLETAVGGTGRSQ